MKPKKHMRFFAKFLPARLGYLDTEMPGGCLDFLEGGVAVGIAHAFDLIETGQRIHDMRRIG